MAEPSSKSFAELGLSTTSLTAIEQAGYEKPSPIQAALIPVAISGRDCVGQARTGTGKTAAFALPILEKLDYDKTDRVQALVVAPTRELSEQVASEFRRLAGDRPCREVLIVGGRPIRSQIDSLRAGAHVAVGTPGRILDLINRRNLDLSDVRFVVLDEADRMLDIGFRIDIEKILKRCPAKRQTLLLSATMEPPIQRLADRFMTAPVRIDKSAKQVVVDTIDQYYVTVPPRKKLEALVKLLLQERPSQAIVFTRTKRGADELYNRFSGRLDSVAAIHGDLPQQKRDRVMKDFRAGRVRLLIATDVVGRGIDVSSVSHIINYDIPEDPDDYVHRVGRTGRMASDRRIGRAFTLVRPGEGSQLTGIEQRINQLLQPYEVENFRGQESKPRPTVEDKQGPSYESFEVDEGFGAGIV